MSSGRGGASMMRSIVLWRILRPASLVVALLVGFEENAGAEVYRRTIAINNSAIDSDLTSFPVLISLGKPDLRDLAHSGHVTYVDGRDIIFTDVSGSSQYDHEIERYDATTGELVCWIRVPLVSSGSPTQFRMYYGDTSGSLANPTGVWDTNFQMVQHFKESSGDALDSTANGRNCTPQGGIVQNATGKANGAYDFDGVDDYGEVAAATLGNTSITVEAWVKFDALDALTFNTGALGGPVFTTRSVETELSPTLTVSQLGGGMGLVFLADGSSVARGAKGSTVIVPGLWYYLAGTFEYTGSGAYQGNWNVYVNGIKDNASANNFAYAGSAALPFTGTTWRIGDHHLWSGGESDAAIDEVRVSTTARSDAWIKASHRNQSDPSAFYTVSGESTGLFHVDAARPDNSGDGFSWATAKKTISAALTAAATGDQIWVKAGTYPEAATLKSGVAVYGGFAGTETSLAQRDYAANISTIDASGLSAPNHAVVMNAIANSRLDGLTIRGGYAVEWASQAATNPNSNGGGILATNSDSTNVITNCTFANNSASWGGAISCFSGACPTITKCSFIGNSARYGGGAVFQNSGASSLNVSASQLLSNQVLWSDGFSSPYSTFGGMGGAVCYNGASGGSATNCEFRGNITHAPGASYPGQGAALYATSGSAGVNVTNCTFSGNTWGRFMGSGTIYGPSGGFTLRNCILWNDPIGEIATPATVDFSDIQGGYSGAGNINADPLFVSSGDLRLQSGSPCKDSGTASGAPSEDLRGAARPQASGFDMGAYEFGQVAAFSATPLNGLVPQDVQFTDQSAADGPAITSWLWNFGDSGTSGAQHPSHTYTAPGIYTVSLAVANGTAGDTETKTNYITILLPPIPSAPTGPGATGIAADAITWTWQDNSNNESGFKVYDDPGSVPPTTLQTTTAADVQVWQHTGLTPNTRYVFQVAATNAGGDSEKTAGYARYTLAGPPSAGDNVACDRSAATPYVAGTTFTFTNPAGFGAGTHGDSAYRVNKFKCVWDSSATYEFTGAEADWNGGTLAQSPMATGDYYLHLQSFNEEDIAGGTLDYGPFRIDADAPTATVDLLSPTPTGSDTVQFAVAFDEAVAPTFDGSDVTVTGTLAGNVDVSGTDPDYVVTVTLTDPDADATVGIEIGSGVTDLAGNPYAGGVSPDCAIYNWLAPYFTTEPANVKKYTGGNHSLLVVPNCAANVLAYQWKWDDGAKTVVDGPATPNWDLSNLSAANRGAYWCEVAYDGTTHESAHATLDVQNRLDITTPPIGGEAFMGGSFTFTVATSGGYPPLTYVWKRNGVPLVTATTNSCTRSPLTPDDNATFTVEIADANADMRSASASLVVAYGVPATGPVGLAAMFATLALAGVRLARRFRRR